MTRHPGNLLVKRRALMDDWGDYCMSGGKYAQRTIPWDSKAKAEVPASDAGP